MKRGNPFMNAIDKRKSYFLVVDTETANGLTDSLVYDCGFTVIDKQGNVYQTGSYVISDIFIHQPQLMETAYYAQKIPNYDKDLQDGKRILINLYKLRLIVIDLLKLYNIKKVWAFNAQFDINALNNTVKFTTKGKYKYFFPYGTSINCIWAVACQTLCVQTRYFKFIQNKSLFTQNGIKTSAEVVYQYITKTDFIEEHTALEDAIIESEILVKCLKQHKKMTTFPRPFPSGMVAKTYKQWKQKRE